jgi:2-phosphosulfolactate phosphatase
MNVIRSEWGLHGVQRMRSHVAVLIIVDVLSFSTSVDIATGRGAEVLPFPYGDRGAAQTAADEADAVLAAPRHASGDQLSLSPRSLTQIAPDTRLMLPSPNGSRLSVEASTGAVLAGCFRNAGAVARAARALAEGGAIGVIPAGERWPDGSLRPAIEDLLGTGAIIHALGGAPDAEAEVACATYRGAGEGWRRIIRSSMTGQELIHGGYAEDVELALQLDVSTHAPLLSEGAYRRFDPTLDGPETRSA